MKPQTGLALALLWGCSQEVEVVIDTSPVDHAAAECDVCQMVVAEQPSPRGQLVYRDGTRAHFCSLGDLRAAVQTRSPHGEPQAVYVEALSPDLDPTALDRGPRPWVSADSAGYVVGLERPQVMGLPVLSYADPGVAQHAAQRLGLRAVQWSELRDTPFNSVP